MSDSGRKMPENRIHLFDPMALVNEKYGQYAPRPRRTTVPYDGGGALHFTPSAKGDSDSDGSSPRLWKPAPPPQNPTRHMQPLSPNSRTQAIARGRRELMDMIKDIPESCYDLSLRDIVDPPPMLPDTTQQQDYPDEGNRKKGSKKSRKTKVGKSESKKKMVRNPSVDNGGFLLKTSVFPIPFRSRKKRSLKQAATKPPLAPPPPKSSGKEKDWWGRKSRVAIESDQSASSSRNSSILTTRQRQNNRFLPSCCSFFNDKRIKPKKFITASSNL